MAKKTSVLYQLPVEEMHGMLATKQRGLQYQGQKADQTPYDLATGKRYAKEYQQFVVLTTTRSGKNSFYVKSRTAINNTTYSKLAQSVLALSSSLANMIVQQAFSTPDVTPYAEILQSYTDFGKDGQSLRDYMTGIVAKAVGDKANKIYVTLKGDQPGITMLEEVGTNPFCSQVEEYKPADPTLSYPKTFDQRALVQKYWNALNSIWRGDIITINYVSPTAKKGSFKLAIESGPTVTFLTWSRTISGNAFGLIKDTIDNTYSMVVYNSVGSIVCSGKLYTDEALTTPVEDTTALSNGMTLYFTEA